MTAVTGLRRVMVNSAPPSTLAASTQKTI